MKRFSDNDQNMTSVLIIACGRCGGFLMAKADQKTRTCPYCGSSVIVEKAKKAASAANSYEASEILKKLKSQSHKAQRDASRL